MDPKKIIDHFTKVKDIQGEIANLTKQLDELGTEHKTESELLQATRTERIQEEKLLETARAARSRVQEDLTKIRAEADAKKSLIEFSDALLNLFQEPADLTIQQLTALAAELQGLLFQKLNLEPLGFKPEFDKLRTTAIQLLEAVLGKQLVTKETMDKALLELKTQITTAREKYERDIKELHEKYIQQEAERDRLLKDNLRLMNWLEQLQGGRGSK